MRSRKSHDRVPSGQWFKSSYSGSHGECVEAAHLGSAMAMRDTRNRELGALFFDADEWQAFTGVARGDLR